jgi:hypothetical protein
MKKDLNYIAALEKAISEKYGQEATANPKAFWSPEKEKEYIEQIKETYKKESLVEKTQEKVDLGGVLIAKKLINKNAKRQCEYCKKYSFNRDDDVYLTKFSSCQICYIKYFEGR